MASTAEECAELRAKHYNATVVLLKHRHSDLVVMRVQPDAPAAAHKPGQYTTLGMGHWEPRAPGCQDEVPKPNEDRKLIRRAYSLSCSVLDESGNLFDLVQQPWLEFYVVLVRESDKGPPALTPRLFTLKEGDRVFLGDKIAGHFTLDPVKPTDSVVFLSTGTGEAPHNYMLWDLLQRGHTGPIVSACCVRMKQDLGYLDLHRRLAERYSNYSYFPLITREPGQGKRYLQDLVESGELAQSLGGNWKPERTHVFLCGNPKMIGVPEKDKETGERTYPTPTGVIELLERRGFHSDHKATKFVGSVHYEEYW